MLPVVLSGSNPAAWEGFSASQHHPLGPQVSSESSFFSIRNSLCLHLSSLLSHCLRRLGPHRCLAIFVLLTFLVSLVATLSSNLAILNGCRRRQNYQNSCSSDYFQFPFPWIFCEWYLLSTHHAPTLFQGSGI